MVSPRVVVLPGECKIAAKNSRLLSMRNHCLCGQKTELKAGHFLPPGKDCPPAPEKTAQPPLLLVPLEKNSGFGKKDIVMFTSKGVWRNSIG
jgi:hypothetical protein